MDYFPLSFDLKQRPCLVVGGGEIARRKIDLILRAGAKITVVSPVLIEELESLRAQGIIDHLARKFEEQDLDGKYLVISATENTLVNERVSQLANQRQLPVNVVDSPDLSTVIFPAIIDRSPLLISVSSGGKAPVMVRKVRELLEATVPQHFARLAG
ncbi:MAG: bifunctional precorrin-2 dehydrogenase/sirohydrochlorin ferrochelatase, partial [Pseudomonadales bacterium]